MNLSILDGREELWQWDTGIRLVMDEACEAVNISASTFGVSVDVTAAEDGKTWVAAVPDEMLQVPGDLICYAVQSTETGTITAAYRSFRVNRRPKPYGYVATPTEARTWQQLYDLIEQGGGGGDVQADWAQNDTTAADYVKNRPGGYYGDPVATEVEVYVGTLADQTRIEEMKALVAGQEYSVYIDGGEKQTFVAFDDDFEGMACVTIGTKSIMEALETDDAWAIAYADDGTRSGGLMVAGTTNYDGKSIVVTTTEYVREARKIPLALLETPPEKEQIFVVTPTEQCNETTCYASATFQEILKAVQDGLTVQLRIGERYYELTSIDGEWAYFHCFNLHTMLYAAVEANYVHLYDDYTLGKNELTYEVTSTYTALYDLNAFDQTFSTVRTRMKFFITIRLLTTTAGSYVQMRYYKGTKTLNLCKHEDIGANKPIVLYGELERTEANDTTFITTLRLLNEDGTPHASGFYYCGELDLASDKSYEGPKIEILSGTEDKFASRQSVKKYYR